jgi:NAD(P)-dependent dehydrogenase (short-subunit alcohol dehydrogenase family)
MQTGWKNAAENGGRALRAESRRRIGALTARGGRDRMSEMARTILVTEGDSPLGEALTRLLSARGLSVVKIVPGSAAAVESGAAPAPPEPVRNPQTARGAVQGTVAGKNPPTAAPPAAVPWNRRSPLSARTVLLNVLNTFDAVDEVLILEPPCAAHPTLHDMPSVEIERAFDDARGPIFLAREALAYFLGRHSGVLCMVSTGTGTSPLESSMRECFHGLCSSLLTANSGQGVVINGFQSGGVQPEEYAAFIEKTLEEKARKITGRWFTCQSRPGFLQGMKSKKA